MFIQLLDAKVKLDTHFSVNIYLNTKGICTVRMHGIHLHIIYKYILKLPIHE